LSLPYPEVKHVMKRNRR